MAWRNRTLAIIPVGGVHPSAAVDGVYPFLSCDAADPNRVSWGDRAGFGLFLLATAALLLRPADWVPALQGAPIYEFIISLCLFLSVPRLLWQICRQSPARPITLLIFAVFVSIVLSHLARGSLYDARVGGMDFLKLFVYYLLILSWVDSPANMRRFMLCLCTFTLAQAIVGSLEYNGCISLSALRSVEQADTNPASGTVSVLRRLCGIGIFDDPNDLCLLLVATAALCFGFTGWRQLGRSRRGWFVPLGFCIYAITLTRSRGGLLSLLGVIGTMLVARYGRGRAMLGAAVLLPVILLIFAGRQTSVDLSDPHNTFQTRLDCWSDSLDLFKHSPLFGVGQEQQVELRGAVAHNSFIQSFAELGIAGGACFLGAFGMAILALHRTNVRGADPELARLRPVLLAIVIGYAIGLLTLSRAYTASTYLILGLAAAYINLTPRLKPLRLDARFAERLATASILFVAATYLFVRVMSA
jgi:putative inorganic carbon (hco3(-)) transporter